MKAKDAYDLAVEIVKSTEGVIGCKSCRGRFEGKDIKDFESRLISNYRVKVKYPCPRCGVGLARVVDVKENI